MSENGSDSANKNFDPDQAEKIDEYLLLNVLMETIPDTIYFKDTGSRFIKVNHAQSKMLGLEKPEDAVGKTDFDFFDAEHSKVAFEDEREIISSQQPVIGKEEKIGKSDGTYCWMSATKVPMFDKEGKSIGIAGISRDITDRKKTEEQLENLAQKLTQSNQELEHFASVASHDLQEPLRKIRAFGDRLRNKHAAGMPDEAIDYLNRMLSATERMQILIDNLLDFSRVGTREHKFIPLDLNEVVGTVISDLEVRIEKTSGRVETENLPTIEADRGLMHQLFQNIIGNALKFHRENVPPVVKVSCRLFTKAKEEFCEIWIEDNGIGFEEKYLEKIFTIFQRLHGREQYEGTGIGLATCRKIVERHHGHLTATSQLGEGSKFIITLPFNHKSA